MAARASDTVYEAAERRMAISCWVVLCEAGEKLAVKRGVGCLGRRDGGDVRAEVVQASRFLNLQVQSHLNCFFNPLLHLSSIVIMPQYHLCGISSVLYRVFIAPNVRHVPTLRPVALPNSRLPSINQTSIRLKSYKKDTRRRALSDYYTLDSAIKAQTVNFIDPAGKFHSRIPIAQARRTVDPETQHLILVSPGKVDIFGRSDPNDMPVCKVVSKMELRQRHQKTLELERRAEKGLGSGKPPKNLELNWAISPGDLKHRLNKLKEFLGEGRKVEILLGPKRRGRVATREECLEVLKRVREAVAECKGAVEKKEPQGPVGGVMTLVFEGKKVEKEKKEAAVE
jgi:translation initiation factor IF-3